MKSIMVRELKEADLVFLLDLWQQTEVMRYADELPRLRGWTKSHDPETAWKLYREKKETLGKAYCQLILCVEDGTLVGESFFAPLEEGTTFGKWLKPQGVMTLLGDLKLAPQYCGRGLGTQGMRQVVRQRFTQTPCDLLCVPPHRRNPAAFRIYQKAGFELFTGMRSHRNHRMMELTRSRYEEIYDQEGRKT